MSKTEELERVRRARMELEPLVKKDYRYNRILNALAKLESEARGGNEDRTHTGSVVQK